MTASFRRKTVGTVEDLSGGALHCHSFGHRWQRGPIRQFGPVGGIGGQNVWELKLHCGSCSMERLDYLNPSTFEVVERRYSRPVKYTVLAPGMTRPDYRSEVVRRYGQAPDGREAGEEE